MVAVLLAALTLAQAQPQIETAPATIFDKLSPSELFPSGKAEPRSPTEAPLAWAALDRVLAQLAAQPTVRLEVACHSNSQGSDGFNLSLTQARAEAIVRLLVQKDVQADRLKAMGYGETRPLFDNATTEGRAQNSRCELTSAR